MRTRLFIAVLCICFCSSMTFAQENVRSSNTATQATMLDDDASSWGPLAGIVSTLNRLDAWFQKNLW